jgi:ribosome-associated translation inhibitor RaiA
MKLNLRFRHVPDTAASRELIAKDVEPIAAQIPVASANAVVEQPSEGSPVIRAALHLEVPGPDIIASASDYTLAAAWNKVMRSIRRQLGRRLKAQSAGAAPRTGPRRPLGALRTARA